MGITWENLEGKKSCHTGMGRTAGWNIPMGLIHKRKNDCDFSERGFLSVLSPHVRSQVKACTLTLLPCVSSAKFFSSGCAPGAAPSSPFCAACAGSGASVGDEFKCKASPDERYYGYAGAFRSVTSRALASVHS